MNPIEQELKNIPLSEIALSPFNPRDIDESSRSFLELVDTVEAVGVIEPVIVRKMVVGFELVAGERRLRALTKVAEGNGGVKKNTIPALVRKLSDQEALEIQTIENIQREDLDPAEEARAFQIWLKEKHGTQEDLARKIGKSARYVRRRILVISLPKKMLKAWGKGEISLTHLEQLTRLRDKKKRDSLFKETLERGLSTRDMEKWVEWGSTHLKKGAKFDPEKVGCDTCMDNSSVQIERLGISADKDRCLNQDCFKKHQAAAIKKTWKKTKCYRKNKTNGFLFHEDLSADQSKGLSNGPGEKCLTCPDFISVLFLNGEVYDDQKCVGKLSCYYEVEEAVKKTAKTNKKKTASPSSSTPAKGPADPSEEDQPRVAWHGSYFRNKFFEQRVPERFDEVIPTELACLRATLYVLIHNSRYSIKAWFSHRHGLEPGKEELEDFDDYYYIYDDRLRPFIDTFTLSQLQKEIQLITAQIMVSNDIGSDALEHYGIMAGVDLSNEFSIDKEYCSKKSKDELVAFGHESGIFEDPKVHDFVLTVLVKRKVNFVSLKKSELVRVFLESGVDLVGKVPAEVLAGGAKDE